MLSILVMLLYFAWMVIALFTLGVIIYYNLRTEWGRKKLEKEREERRQEAIRYFQERNRRIEYFADLLIKKIKKPISTYFDQMKLVLFVTVGDKLFTLNNNPMDYSLDSWQEEAGKLVESTIWR